MAYILDDITQKIYVFIRDYQQSRHLNPTIREIGKGCYLSHSAVLPHLAKLEALEWIVREIGVPRSIRLGERAPDYKETTQ